MAIDGPELVGR